MMKQCVDDSPKTPEELALEKKTERKVLREAKKVARDAAYAKHVAEQQVLNAKLREQAEERTRLALLPKTLRCANGGLLDVPLFNEHFRAKNWGAIVTVDPARPGGLERVWFERGNGPSRYILPRTLAVGHIVEFGADYVTSVGKRKPQRWFAVVMEIAPDKIVLKPCASIVDALSGGRAGGDA